MFRCLLLVLALAGSLLFGKVDAAVYDHLYRDGFQPVADAPASDAEAARFLIQATFGPTRAEITRLRGLGYSQWIDQQLSALPTFDRPYLQALDAALVAGGQGNVSHDNRLNRWFHNAAYAPDQLRQRMAFALSQIMVISDQDGNLAGEVFNVAEYGDMLLRNAFGNLFPTLSEVAYNPSMGKYLSHFRNRKASVPPAAPREPDENFAREIMQLFTIGLVQRNMDFSPVLAAGQPVPTYDQNDIVQLAKVFTGLNYYNATTISNGTNDFRPMNCIPIEHDLTAKTFLGFTINATVLPGGYNATTDPSNLICRSLPGQTRRDIHDMNLAVAVVFNHPNVAPFISRQLIQRFVSSNPSPAYIQRVALTFENNGQGERGDLGAVVKAILLDPEARTAPTLPTQGKAREPLLRLTALWRAWDAQVPPTTQYGEVRMGMTGPTGTYGQRPLGAPTVFNFWEPDYQPAGPMADAGQYGPEFQVIHEGTTFNVTNSLYNFSWNSWLGMASPPTDRPLLRIAPLEALAGNPTAMVDEAGLRMLGTMSSATRTTLINMITFMAGASANEKARSLIYLIALSPDYAVQR